VTIETSVGPRFAAVQNNAEAFVSVLMTVEPVHWAGWLAYVFEELDSRTKEDDFLDALNETLLALDHRIVQGGW